jgi:hypothetical protein
MLVFFTLLMMARAWWSLTICAFHFLLARDEENFKQKT